MPTKTLRLLLALLDQRGGLPLRALVASAVAVVLVVALAAPHAALAHERRNVGKYQLVVGFINEPALLGEPNGVDLRITTAETGVQGAHQTLKMTVAAGGGQPKEFPLRARFGQPGAYVADFIPTRAGSYIFTFTGTLEGQTINERFESGPGRFDDVVDAARLQYPLVVPPAAELLQQVKAAERAAQAAEAEAAVARTLGVVGSGLGILGVLGLALGAWALALARRSGRAAVAPANDGPQRGQA